MPTISDQHLAGATLSVIEVTNCLLCLMSAYKKKSQDNNIVEEPKKGEKWAKLKFSSLQKNDG